MNIEAPTFNALNKPQKRALILRDQLRFVDPQHLNGFLEGVSNDEPPTYTKINGVIKPEFALVTLKEEATRFDLGNVLLSEEKNAVHRVYLVVENGHIQMRVEDPLPQDDDVLDSLPIHGFIARGMVPLFRDKFQAIYSRMDKINEARRAAYNMAHKTPTSFHEGETLTRLNPSKAEQVHTVSSSKILTRPEPDQEVRQHVSNKRKRTGLDIIPEDAKSRTFDTIPSKVKVDLFNSIVSTAFPNFDNLMTASWNVVSIYSACGSDFPELHRAIVDLKRVLQDFDKAFGKRVDRETPKYRHDFVGPSRSEEDEGRNGDCKEDNHGDDGINHSTMQKSTSNENAGGSTYQANSSPTSKLVLQQRKDIKKESSEQAAPKARPDKRQPFEDSDKEEGEIDEDEDEDAIPHKDPRLVSNETYRTSTQHSSPPRIKPPANHPHTKPQSTTSLRPFTPYRYNTDPRPPHTPFTPKSTTPHKPSASPTKPTLQHQNYKPHIKIIKPTSPPASKPSTLTTLSSDTSCVPSSPQSKSVPRTHVGISLLGARKSASADGVVAPVANMLPSSRRMEDQKGGDCAGDGNQEKKEKERERGGRW